MRHPSSLIRRMPSPAALRQAGDAAPAREPATSPRGVRCASATRTGSCRGSRSGPPALADPTRDRAAFEARCAARDRERAADHAYPFGVFVDQQFAGEVNLNNVTRGALQGATIGYWIDRDRAGHGYIAEAVVVLLPVRLRAAAAAPLEICIVPRNTNSRRVVEKLGLRCEGLAERYLEIAGVWEDHLRFAITAEEWDDRGPN